MKTKQLILKIHGWNNISFYIMLLILLNLLLPLQMMLPLMQIVWYLGFIMLTLIQLLWI